LLDVVTLNAQDDLLIERRQNQRDQNTTPASPRRDPFEDWSE
jgi:hypothetical protein